MLVVQVASEVAPFVKTGGLGDVLGALPASLARHADRVVVVMPRYGSGNFETLKLTRHRIAEKVMLGAREVAVAADLAKDRKSKVEYLFVHNEEFFGRPGIYQDPRTGTDYPDNAERFIYFSKALFALLTDLHMHPDILHIHDWQAAAVAPLLKLAHATDVHFSRTRVVLTIHNLAFQGRFPATSFPLMNLSRELMYATAPFEYYGDMNLLKAAILYADKITTVSPNYAQEMQHKPEFGAGLDGVLRTRTTDISGILNGVDYTVWSPSRDRHLPYTYYPANLAGKQKVKVEFLNALGLPLRDRVPLIGMITRLTEQKGIDLLEANADSFLSLPMQFVALGSGEARFEKMLRSWETLYPDKVRTFMTFDNALAHKIEAASDIFLMPSRFEPCGLNQMYSLKYGTIPIVHRVGGLADTVIDNAAHPETGTGFVFSPFEFSALRTALDQAIHLFHKKREWFALMKRAMRCDFSWTESAREYHGLYESLTSGGRQ